MRNEEEIILDPLFALAWLYGGANDRKLID